MLDMLSEDASKLSLREFTELCSSAYMLTVLSAESIPESIRISHLWMLANKATAAAQIFSIFL